MTTIKDIYNCLDELAPFSLQESYDNSGLIIGNMSREVTKVVIALDITTDTANEAVLSDAELVITHHPVIFSPLKRIDTATPLGMLLTNNVAVISSHTNFDSAVMNEILCEKLSLTPKAPLCTENGTDIGFVCDCEKTSAKELAKRAKEALGCVSVRYVNTDKAVERVAVCSGSGGSFLHNAISLKCDAYITGDVKHDVFIDAFNNDIALIDAGHFYTENIFCEYVKEYLQGKFADVEFAVAKSNRDVTDYEI